MITCRLLPSLGLTLLTTVAVSGEARCPSSVETIQYHSLSHSQIDVPVAINGTGPYEFLVDTGSQITIIEPSLAAELELKPQGDIHISAVGNHSKAELVIPDLIEAGPFAVRRPLVVVESLAQIQAHDSKIRGLLGGSFLRHFDVLIDYAHKLLCLDETMQMRQDVRGEHVAVIQQSDGQQNLPFPHRLLVPAHLAGGDTRDVLLMLDSQSNVPLLYEGNLNNPAWLLSENSRMGSVVGQGSQMALTVLPSEEVRIGSRVLHEVSFLAPASTEHKTIGAGEDGLLPAALFNRVFISYADHFVIFDPR
jgi:Aspartyl protease